MAREYDGDLISVILKKLKYATRLTADHQVYIVAGAPYTQKKYKNFSRRYRKLLNLNRQEYQKKVEKYFPIKKVAAGELKIGNLLLYPIQCLEKNSAFINLSTYLTKTTRLGPVPKEIPLNLPITHELLKFIGYYIAEGSNHRAYIRFSLGNHEEDFGQEIVNLSKELFGLEAKIHRRVGKKTGIEITICHSKLANIFENLCGKGAESKHIPFMFWELPPVKQKIIIDAIYRGDGTTFKVSRSQKWQKSITSISLTLAEQLIDMLLRCNFFPSLHIGKSHVDKNNVRHRETYSVFWSEQRAQKYNLIYYGQDGSQYWILPIEKLKQTRYRDQVYNLTVEDDHSYVSTGFAVANCGKGGDIFTFLMEIDRIEFPEALKLLATRAGVKLETHPSTTKQQEMRQKLLEIHHLASEFYAFLLTKHPIGARARHYLHTRGVNEALIKTFSLGFAPNSWDNLSKFLRKKGYDQRLLEQSGLILRGSSGWYDRFRGRIMFPLKNYRGETIAFSGRILDSQAQEAKYINSPETPLYIKGETLYGLDSTKEAIRKAGSAIIVEGEFDVISSYHAGVTHVVAIKGSALTEAQVNLLKRFTERIVLSLDADTAGDAASRRGIEIADHAGLDIRVVEIPSGKDPDEAARGQPEVWKKATTHPIPFYDFLIQSAFKRFDSNDSFGKKKISDELLPAISKISNTIVQAHYVKLFAQKLGISEEKILEALQKLPKTSLAVTQDTKVKKTSYSHQELLEQHLLSLVLQSQEVPGAIKRIGTEIDPSDFIDRGVKRIFMELITFISDKHDFVVNEFAKVLPAELVSQLNQAYLTDLSAFTSAETTAKELNVTLKALKAEILRAKIKSLSQDLVLAQTVGDEGAVAILNTQLTQTTAQLKQL